VGVVNVPGGGLTKGADRSAARAKLDGLSIPGTSGSTQLSYLRGDLRVGYDHHDRRIMMAAPTGGAVCTSPSTGVTGPQGMGKLIDQTLIYLSQGAMSLDLAPLLGFKLNGVDVRHVFDVKGRGDGRPAFERGEANIDCQTPPAYIENTQPLVDAGTAIALFSWGALDEDGNPVRDAIFPDLPHFGEACQMMTGKAPVGPDYDVCFAFFTARFPAQKMVYLPKGTPADIVEAYQAAVTAMKVDPEYQALKLAVLSTYEQVTGTAAKALFDKGTVILREPRMM
jgi:hypothetical protein